MISQLEYQSNHCELSNAERCWLWYVYEESYFIKHWRNDELPKLLLYLTIFGQIITLVTSFAFKRTEFYPEIWYGRPSLPSIGDLIFQRKDRLLTVSLFVMVIEIFVIHILIAPKYNPLPGVEFISFMEQGIGNHRISVIVFYVTFYARRLFEIK